MRVLLGVTGCIGAYKAAEVLRGLQRAGADVRVIMTRSATEFVRPLTFEALSGLPVIVEMFDRASYAEIEHISVAREADLLLVAPATANIIAKFAHGIADDFLSAVYLSNTNPVLLAPAMNVEMWNHAATQANLSTLRDRGVEFVDPDDGYQACGEVGVGRLADIDRIVKRSLDVVESRRRRRDLEGEHILVTAGPTIEELDPVRYLSNRSSGKMGFALASAARARGASVILVAGPTRLEPPVGVNVVSVRSTAQMYQAVMDRLPETTVFIGCAAVSDFRPVLRAAEKLKKTGSNSMTLELETTEDIIAAVGDSFSRTNGDRKLLVGFAAESEELLANAEKKLQAKGMDLIVANDITRSDAGFDSENNAVTLIRRDGSRIDVPLATKRAIANRVLDEIIELKQ
ncbi:MAG: bifunctional phosphopantothenoylcysteine decarboxylase/phosphopantothenate--cysteine ligase CoaBC [Acidobacteriota bacterium]